MYGKMKDHLSKTLAEIRDAGLYKEERIIESAQQAAITAKRCSTSVQTIIWDCPIIRDSSMVPRQ